MPVTVSSLWTYPVKSCRGIPHNDIDVTWRGLANDRLWMVVDGEGHFLSQRDQGCAKMARVKAMPSQYGLMLSVPGKVDVFVNDPQRETSATRVHVSIWNDTAPAYDAGDEAAEWMSGFLGRDCRIVRIADTRARLSDLTYAQAGEQVGFADGFAALFTSEASLQSLNVEAKMDRFRPNIVLNGLKPFEEDTIATLQIGGTMFNFLKPCARCAMPSINQLKGEYERATNPLPTLMKQRQGEGGGLKGIFFGQNAAPSILGTISIGMEAHIIARKQPHPALQNLALRYA